MLKTAPPLHTDNGTVHRDNNAVHKDNNAVHRDNNAVHKDDRAVSKIYLKVQGGPGFWGGGVGADKNADRHTHQYHDSAWPRGRPKYKYTIICNTNFLVV